MPFITECPFCHAKMRVPDDAIGLSWNCPRCGDSFTLARMENPPEVTEAKLRPPAASAAAAAVLAAVHAEEAEEAAEAAAEAAAAVASGKPAPPPKPVEPWREPRTFPYELLGPVALVLGGLGAACAPIPGCQPAMYGLAASAAVIGLTGWIAAARPDRGGKIKPAVGCLLGCTVVVVTLVWPDLLGGGPPFGDNTPRPFGRETPDPAANVLMDAPEGMRVAIPPFRLGTLSVRLLRAETGPVQLSGTGPTDRGMQITLRVFNGSQTHPLTYHGWSRPMPGDRNPSTVLRDNHGKVLALHTPLAGQEIVGQVREVKLPPVGQTDDVLVFDLPPSDASSFTLELPLAAVGATGTFSFSIPGSAITTK